MQLGFVSAIVPELSLEEVFALAADEVVEFDTMIGRPPDAEIDTAGLGEHQLEIRSDTAFDEQPGEQRPHLQPVQIGQPRRCRPVHPHREITVTFMEPARCASPLRALCHVDIQRVDETEVVIEPAAGGDRRVVGVRCCGHDSTFLARAHSAATVSGAR